MCGGEDRGMWRFPFWSNMPLKCERGENGRPISKRKSRRKSSGAWCVGVLKANSPLGLGKTPTTLTFRRVGGGTVWINFFFLFLVLWSHLMVLSRCFKFNAWGEGPCQQWLGDHVTWGNLTQFFLFAKHAFQPSELVHIKFPSRYRGKNDFCL